MYLLTSVSLVGEADKELHFSHGTLLGILGESLQEGPDPRSMGPLLNNDNGTAAATSRVLLIGEPYAHVHTRFATNQCSEATLIALH